MENSVTATKPYFIKNSINLEAEKKKVAYEKAYKEISTILNGEKDIIVKMATINCILKINLPYAYWVGFYCYNNDKLTVGPYQGTLGCLHINIGKGVCGKSAESKETIIIDDVTALQEGSDHITCDPNSKSEIVLPVLNKHNELIAVLDIDSTVKSSFDEIDKFYLEKIISEQFK